MERKSLLLLAKAVGLVAIGLVVMLVVNFIGGQSILPWASFFVTIIFGIPSLLGSQGKFDFSLDVDRTVEPQQAAQTMTPKISNSIDWTNDAEKNLEKVNNSPEWRKVEDSTYSLWRQIGSRLYSISNRIQSNQYIDKNHVSTGQIVMVVFGCSWFLIILIELMVSGGLNPVGFSALAEISPLSYSVSSLPVLQLAISLALFLVPIGYLDWKTGTTCDDCNIPFTLRSKGKYWHPDLKEEKTEDRTKVTIYHGVRFRECENCGTLLQDTNFSWKDSN